ncbi:MAG: RagB/SusD family nutrient uptake outer membrane protein [Alistipes sp.]|nr:RagB/SusD family nutrient uptake outer membrane protein [Alistipes sp.]
MQRLRIATYLLLAGVTLTLISCSDFLDENAYGKLPTEEFFSNKEDLDASLNALYSVVSTSQYANHFVGTNFLAGDDISTHPSSNKQPLREHDQYSVSDNNSWMINLWEQRYKVIKAANFIINNASRTPEVTQQEIAQAKAIAHFWRAFSYFYLVTTWGKVPVMLGEDINYNAPLQSIESIYELVLSDLAIAEQDCPILYDRAPYSNNGVNVAVGKLGVKAVMSYVYLCMAGWPLNLGTSYYKLAAEKAEQVIDMAEQGKLRLLDNYSDVHSMRYNQSNPEVVLGIYYNRNRSPQMVPLTDLLFDMKQGGWGDTNGEIKFWKEFPEGPRKEATYFPKIMLSDGKLYDWWYDTAPPTSRQVVAPVFMKSVEPTDRTTEFDYTDPTPLASSGEKTAQIVRLSEVYCWYAEAVGRSGKVTTKAVEVLNRVRNRADGATTNLYTTSMSADELAEAAYNEHGWEIAGYYWCGFASRSRDMFRMYRHKEHFEYRKLNPEIEVAPGVFRKESVPVSGTWDDSKMYCPYPYEDMVLNPGLKK